ncbi:carbon-phosphorus lyase complex subunit PhnI [Cohnella abietis]|uniref:Carbon-phosphorus lyase complex subunit PhnI n=1 Tax=Cohnella abietis TaxID=2507935 RepID=A0A3T1DCS4_9BACL|nr:carbon-phosphorus lyase complex subunit PhnI [Cohnella abietis]BBI35930.1 carbon-phosphorus lyase complex subunit PhnI [Cohnella abietis]
MAYVAVTGGQRAIKEAEKLLKVYRCQAGDPPIEVSQIMNQMRLAVDRVMGEGSLYDPLLAALALKQAEGDAIEASFLIRAFRSTLPRNLYSQPIDTSDMDIIRRVSATFKDIPGGQYLGPTRDYSRRMLQMELLDENEENVRSFLTEYFKHSEINEIDGESKDEPLPSFPRVIDLLRSEGLLADKQVAEQEDATVDDITRNAISFPASRAARLQLMARGETGALLALAYSSARGYGDVHPTIGELRVGYVSLEIPHPIYEGESICIGKVLISEAEIVVREDDEASDSVQFGIGYGLCFGHNEDKVIAMGILDSSMKSEAGHAATPAEDEEFVLYHIDGIESSGFISHFKLPHYVDFQAELARARSINRKGT